MKINWKSKLSSRKFWVAVIGLITSIMMVFDAGESDVSKITAAITALGSVVSYILGESIVDASKNNDQQNGEEANK